MSGNHDTKSNDEERLLNAELLVEHWMNKANSYKEMMDSTASELDWAFALLRRCETEMRYAGWGMFVSDNPVRKEVFDDVVEFLK